MKRWTLALLGSASGLLVFLVFISIIIVYRYHSVKKRQIRNLKSQDNHQKRLNILNKNFQAGTLPFVPQLSFAEAESSLSLVGKDQRAHKPIGSNATGSFNPKLYKEILAQRGAHSKKYKHEQSDFAEDKTSDDEFNLKLAATKNSTVYYSLSYNDGSIKVRIEKVTNLPMQYRKNCSSYVKVSLESSKGSKVTNYTSVINQTLNPSFDEEFAYKINVFETADSSEHKIKISVFVKLNLKDKYIGKSEMKISESIFSMSSNPINFASNLKSKRKKAVKGPLEKDSFGQLFVLMQYQSDADRMKILIRKAENLPKIQRSFRQSEFYVVLVLMKENIPLSYKETRSSNGSNPIWNEPFLFDIPTGSDINDFWFQFIVMKGRLSHKDDVIGHVLIGSNTTENGIAHWNQTIVPTSVEVAKWHNILSI